MLAKLEQHAAPLSAAGTRRISHLLVVQPKAAKLDARTPHLAALEATLARRKKKPDELAKSPVTVDAPGGALVSWVMIDAAQSAFEQHTAMRKAVSALLTETPAQLDIAVYGDAVQRAALAELAAYTAWVNGVKLPERKKSKENKPLRTLVLHGHAARGLGRGIK